MLKNTSVYILFRNIKMNRKGTTSYVIIGASLEVDRGWERRQMAYICLLTLLFGVHILNFGEGN